MAWRVTAEHERFDEAVDHFAQRITLSDEERKLVPERARSRAFWIAGASQLDVVQSVKDSLDKAIADGTPLDAWKKQVRQQLADEWGGDNPKRLELIMRNAAQTSYNAGRWYQLTEPSVLRLRPFFQFDAVIDDRTTEPCRTWDTTILPAEHEFWLRAWPPIHHGCRSSVRSLRRSQAEREGVSESPPDGTAQQGFGAAPPAAQEWRPNPVGRDARLMAELERKRADLARRAALPPLPATFGPRRPKKKAPARRRKLRTGQFTEVSLSPEQQVANQTAERLRNSYEARASASYEERRTWLLWEWTRGSNRKTSAVAKEAARREFGLAGVPWYRDKPFNIQPADVARTQRDLRRLHDETQAWFKLRGQRSVTLYRGVHGNTDDPRNTIESWTSDEATAKRFASRGPNGRVLRVTVPVAQILAHHGLGAWLDGPWGSQREFLVLW
jgi:SPP1 gp7 family putative phage head morphogenesis protein